MASKMLGLKGKLPLAQFKPALGINPDILARYAANRLRVVRQVHYSQHNENSIDFVLFLNGLPVATVELKTDFTQSIGDAIDQHRFAVSNREVHMTTRLDGLVLTHIFGSLRSSHRWRGGVCRGRARG